MSVCACVCISLQVTASILLKQSNLRVQGAWSNLKSAGFRRFLDRGAEAGVQLARIEASSSDLVKKVVSLFEHFYFTPKVCHCLGFFGGFCFFSSTLIIFPASFSLILPPPPPPPPHLPSSHFPVFSLLLIPSLYLSLRLPLTPPLPLPLPPPNTFPPPAFFLPPPPPPPSPPPAI